MGSQTADSNQQLNRECKGQGKFKGEYLGMSGEDRITVLGSPGRQRNFLRGTHVSAILRCFPGAVGLLSEGGEICYVDGQIPPPGTYTLELPDPVAVPAGSERSGGLTPEQAHQLSELFRLMPRLPNQESYTMSNMNSGKWAKVPDSQDLSFRLCDKLRPARQEKRDIPLFGWTEENESAQASRYGPHIQRIISTGREVLWKDVSNNRQFLDVTLHAGDSNFHLKGTSDYVAVTKASVRARVISAGLLMLFELKKDIQNDDIFQSMAQLLAANILSPELKPTVVCTDLRDEWQLFWLDGNTIFQHTAQSRSAAVALLEDILDGAAKSATTEGLEREEESSSRSPGVADAFSVERVLKRQKFATADAHGGSLAQIADLQGFLPDEEYKDALLRSALQDLLNIPSLASLHEPRSPLIGMYI